jgi:hypothetical protein
MQSPKNGGRKEPEESGSAEWAEIGNARVGNGPRKESEESGSGERLEGAGKAIVVKLA